MYCRLIRYAIRPDRIEEARALGDGILAMSRDLEGVKELINLQRSNGTGILMGIYADKESADAAAPRIIESLSQIVHLLADTPVPEAYRVINHEVIE